MRKSLAAFVMVCLCATVGFCQQSQAPVEINADQVQYSVIDSKVTANGNVVIKRLGVTLTCDSLEFDRDKNIGIAQGHVVLVRENSRLTGDKLIYNFSTMKGDFVEAKVTAKPYYGAGKQITKESENHIILHDGYITTCDLDKPHFKLDARRVDIYQGDKAVARNMTMVVGNVPVFFLPRYTQDLKHQEPMFIITPGYSKDWGTFVLSQWRHWWNDNVNTVLRLDYRSRRGLGEGADLNYKDLSFGSGFVKMYFAHERLTNDKFFVDFNSNNNTLISEEDRYKGEWRNKWNIDDRTMAIWQYYKLSDGDFLKDYFKKEYERDTNPTTYFLLTRGLSKAGTLSFRTDVRVNDYVSAVNRLPEINYILSGYKILDTRFYWNNNTTYSNLAQLTPNPMTNRYETMRLDTDNQISYPMKVKFIELRPFVGGEETYYSKTLDKPDNNTVRGIFKTGADLSTKFYRVYDVKTNFLNLDINHLRHVVTPSIAYFYTHDPTLESTKLVQFDDIDNRTRGHGMTFGLENKLQTKRGKKSEDLLRFLVSTDFYLKEDTHKGGFNILSTKTDFMPNKLLTIYEESKYDTKEDHLNSASFDIYFHPTTNKWSVSLGRLYDRDVDDQITGQFNYRINQKWYFEIYQRWNATDGTCREQQYSVVRDLHEWEAKITFNHKENNGDEIWIMMTLKEFPNMGINMSTGFNKRQEGSR